MTIVFFIKKIRKEKGISISELSKLTGISQPYLTRLENNDKDNANLICIQKISDALGVDIKKVFMPVRHIEELRKKLNKSLNINGATHEKTILLGDAMNVVLNRIDDVEK